MTGKRKLSQRNSVDNEARAREKDEKCVRGRDVNGLYKRQTKKQEVFAERGRQGLRRRN